MIRIMTWNTGLNNTPCRATDVFNYVKNFLENNNTIAFLQEIPIKCVKVNPDGTKTWSDPKTYWDFKRAFPKNKYRVFMNNDYNNGFLIMCTVAITKMKNVKEWQCISRKATNREISVSTDELTFYSVHAQVDEKNTAINKNYLLSMNNIGSDIILGDFNSGYYPECKTRITFRNILKNYVCICNMPTKEVRDGENKIIRRTCIDHIFVKEDLITKCSSLAIHENIDLSDHYPITFNVE